jgi:hypothetical protein
MVLLKLGVSYIQDTRQRPLTIVRDPKIRIKGSNKVNSKVERTIQSSA